MYVSVVSDVFAELISVDPEERNPRKFDIERKVSGRLKCFKRCSVPKRLAYVLRIFRHFFGTVSFPNGGFCGKGLA